MILKLFILSSFLLWDMTFALVTGTLQFNNTTLVADGSKLKLGTLNDPDSATFSVSQSSCSPSLLNDFISTAPASLGYQLQVASDGKTLPVLGTTLTASFTVGQLIVKCDGVVGFSGTLLSSGFNWAAYTHGSVVSLMTFSQESE